MVYVGSDDNSTYAFNAKTGDLLWTKATGGHVRDSPTVADGVVYWCTRDSSGTSMYALSAKTGDVLWTKESKATCAGGPTVYDGVGYEYVKDTSIRSSMLYAFNKAGAVLWTAAIPDGSSGYNGGPAVADGVVYVQDDYGDVYAFNDKTGDMLWKAAI